MTTTPDVRTDEQVQQDVLAELRWDARVQPNEVAVAAQDGIVTLAGWVDNYVKRWAAERAAQRVRGVVAVANEIQIRPPAAGGEPTDTEVASAAAQVLEWNALVPADQVEVTVSAGRVMLRGEVEWEYERREAERAVRGLAGVRGVTNAVAVRPRQRVEPEAVERRIEQALLRSAETDAERIMVERDGDTVILRGAVRSWPERRDAERAAWSAPGVRSVENDIRISP
ncbi:BON domain-containing protein [Phytohabitans sp. ZYX-F-186]|uniref:BON domain-containing protein n=1 Tax=Phytohabitans maris TaxID=3071409 RepID=A0ABU0ZA59_9ACTN|nr:BON domain-containing protein [Phytohabitans sp. ZYX-F-186]MDQ7903863.1 BON domain-containing protein [Phytohabitans sp. ZYX-F-186]